MHAIRWCLIVFIPKVELDLELVILNVKNTK